MEDLTIDTDKYWEEYRRWYRNAYSRSRMMDYELTEEFEEATKDNFNFLN